MDVWRRLFFSSLFGVGAALAPLTAAMAQTSDVTGTVSWTTPAVVGLTLIAGAGITLTLLQRRKSTEIQGRLDTVGVASPKPALPPAKTVTSKATADVLRLVGNPAVAPQPGGAVDLSADPWT